MYEKSSSQALQKKICQLKDLRYIFFYEFLGAYSYTTYFIVFEKNKAKVSLVIDKSRLPQLKKTLLGSIIRITDSSLCN